MCLCVYAVLGRKAMAEPGPREQQPLPVPPSQSTENLTPTATEKGAMREPNVRSAARGCRRGQKCSAGSNVCMDVATHKWMCQHEPVDR